jgi:opacity protein-like surface antigen
MRSGWIRRTFACGLVVAGLAVAGVAQADEIKAGEIIVPEEPPPPPPVVEKAVEEINYNRHGFYLGLGPSFFAENFEGDIGRLGACDTWGFHARAGYRFLDFLAVEGLYEYANDFGDEIDENNRYNLQTNVFTANLKAIAPLGRVQPYLGGGAGFMRPQQSRVGVFQNFDWDEYAFAGRVNGGLDVYLTPQLSLGADANWVIPTDDLEDLEYISVNFGARIIF